MSRKRLDYCLLDEQGGRVEVGATPPDADGLAGFARRVEWHMLTRNQPFAPAGAALPLAA